MKNKTKPNDASHVESDGTFWKLEKAEWFYWNPHFKKWCGYVGLKNKDFINKLMTVA